MRKLLPLFFFGLLMLAGCTNDPGERMDTPEENDSAFTEDELMVLSVYGGENGTLIAEEEAIEAAQDIIDLLDSDPQTRAGSARKVRNIVPLRSDIGSASATRSDNLVANTATVIWGVNFDKNAGYTLIAADTRIRQTVLGVCEFGNLPEEGEEPVENEGLYLYLEMAEEYALIEIEEMERMKDSLTLTIIEKLEQEYGEYLTDEEETRGLFDFGFNFKKLKVTVKTEKVGSPLVAKRIYPMIPIEWNQGSPYNNKVPNKGCANTGNSRCWTGCVAIAGGQIMSMYKYPTSVNGVTLNWNTINKYSDIRPGGYYAWVDSLKNASPATINQVATLVEAIGRGVSTDYGCKSSSSNAVRLAEYLRNNGYEMNPPKKLVTMPSLSGNFSFSYYSHVGYSYDANKVTASIENGYPVIIRGKAKKIKIPILGITVGHKEGHAWNIDGLLKRQQKYKKTVTIYKGNLMISQDVSYYYETDNLHHHNFGHGGGGNGYYASGVFHKVVGMERNSDMTRSGESGNWQYNVNIWTEVRRK